MYGRTDGINRQKKNILQQVGAKGIQVTRFVEFLRALFICSNLVGPIFWKSIVVHWNSLAIFWNLEFETERLYCNWYYEDDVLKLIHSMQ